MAAGLVIHISVGDEKRTEFFSAENIRFGSDETSDLQIHTKKLEGKFVWFELEWTPDDYRVTKYDESLEMLHNGIPIHSYVVVGDGDVIEIPGVDISFSFFSLDSKSSLITTNREQPHIAHFIETAAIDAAATPRRDDAKAFLREFVRELSREISWATKLIILAIVIGSLSGVFYLGVALNRELKQNREQSEQQNTIIKELQAKIDTTKDQIGEIDKTSKDMMKTVSVANSVNIEYRNGVGLIYGVYDLVDRKNGKTLRYPDPEALMRENYDPPSVPVQEDLVEPQFQMGLTTEGGGSIVEYDFIGTGFHVGGGYIVTNRHVIQPWKEDDLVQQMIRTSNGRARIKRLVIYFPGIPQAFPLKIRQVGGREDVAVGTIDPNLVPADLPVLPVDEASDAVAIGKTVVSMGFPNGPDRLLAMADDDDVRSLNSRCSGSRRCIIDTLAQSNRIVPLTTQGSITDLDSRRVVHDAKTAEGGSGAPLFGQNGKVIAVNFGVFTESNAANMAVPVSFAVDLLKKAGWKSPESAEVENQTASAGATPAVKN
ncbi:MAG: trypsin-like peptidase domain-containing protein [Pyrinomonadaceae bacterium]|nr:trypsin-like peptidase domain-containing protein [Pyrinomonadaceae bacterium]